MEVLFGVILGLLLTHTNMASPTEQTSEVRVSEANNLFARNLYNILSKTEGNVFFSPISVHAVLSMALQGAQGDTLKQIAETLQVADQRVAGEGYSQIMKRLNNVENVTLLMANKVYLMEAAKLLTDFQSSVVKDFSSEVQQVNFAANVQAAKTINEWVEGKTNNKIKDLISSDDLNALTRLVLVNAIYFKGDWLHQFKKDATKREPFYLNDNDHIDVDMMHIKKKFRYKNDDSLDAQVLELPYTNTDLSLVIILPNQRNGIKDLEKRLETVNLGDVTNDMYNTEVNVALPKFKIEQTIDLQDALTALGLGGIFDPNDANFRGMIELQPKENLYVSKVVQKAFIEVNEEGAEAAAATGMVMTIVTLSLVQVQELYFTADHPFVFVLKNKETTLFMGRISRF